MQVSAASSSRWYFTILPGIWSALQIAAYFWAHADLSDGGPWAIYAFVLLPINVALTLVFATLVRLKLLPKMEVGAAQRVPRGWTWALTVALLIPLLTWGRAYLG